MSGKHGRKEESNCIESTNDMTHMIDILCYRVRRCDSHERHDGIEDYDVRSDATEDRNHGKNGKSRARTTSLIRERKNVQQHCFRVKTISMQKT